MEPLRRCASCSISMKVMADCSERPVSHSRHNCGYATDQLPPMQRLTPRQLAMLALLTLVWGLNWPVMKVGVSHFPALSFRAVSIMLGVPVLGLALVIMK